MPADPAISIISASGPLIASVRGLWIEYWESLGLPPDFQNFAVEMEGLPGAYGPPKGRLLIALIDDRPAGAAALRPLTQLACEAKRLYVRPQFRGKGIAKSLLQRLIQEARDAGYQEMYGDAEVDVVCPCALSRDGILRGRTVLSKSDAGSDLLASYPPVVDRHGQRSRLASKRATSPLQDSDDLQRLHLRTVHDQVRIHREEPHIRAG